MAFGYIEGGAPVEITGDVVLNGVAWSLASLGIIPAEERAGIGFALIVEPDPPAAGHYIASTALQLVDGAIVRVATYAEIPAPTITVPAKVHKFWLIKVLEGLGEMDDIEDAMDAAWAAGNRSLKREWLAATEIERANQLVNEFADSRGKTSEQVDQMFIQAAAYQAAASNS